MGPFDLEAATIQESCQITISLSGRTGYTEYEFQAKVFGPVAWDRAQCVVHFDSTISFLNEVGDTRE